MLGKEAFKLIIELEMSSDIKPFNVSKNKNQLKNNLKSR